MANLAPRRHSGDDFDHPMLAFYQSSPAAEQEEEAAAAAAAPSVVQTVQRQRRGRLKNGHVEDPPRRRLSDGALRLAGALVSGLDEEAEECTGISTRGQNQTRPPGPPPPTSLASLAASLRRRPRSTSFDTSTSTSRDQHRPSHVGRVASGGALSQALGGLNINLGFGGGGGGGRARDIALHLQNAREAEKAARYQEALLEYRSAEQIQIVLYGAESIEVADTLHDMGLVLVKLGAMDPAHHYSAMTSFEGALAIRQSLLGPGHESAAETTTQITMLLDKIREDTGQGSRKLIRGGDSDGSMDALSGRSSLYSVYESDSDSHSDDDEDDGIEKQKNSYTVEEGQSLIEMGRYKEAEAVLASCLEQVRRKNSTGGNLRSSMERVTLNQMARVGQALGKYDQAKEAASQALELARIKAADRKYTDQRANSELAKCIATYAEVLRKNKELEMAERLHREALGIRQEILSEGHQGAAANSDDKNDEHNLALAESHTCVGCVLLDQSKYEKAYRRHRLALYIRVTCLDFIDIQVSESLNYAAQSLAMLGSKQAGKAIPFALHSIEIRKLEFGMKHPAFAHSLSVLAACYHAAGRSFDSLPFWEQCLDICQAAFYPKHPNLIPNHVGYGKALEAVGKRKAALVQFCKAEEIHLDNFVVEDVQLLDIRAKIEGLLQNSLPCSSPATENGQNSQNGGDPLIIITDIGRDVDDELALCLLKPLTDLKHVRPVAVITTLTPQEDRARLARGTLDSLGLYDVPVGIGSNGGVDDEAAAGLECYAGTFRAPKSSILEQNQNASGAGIVVDGLGLMINELKKAAPKTVRVLCLASLNDVAQLIEKDESLFAAKVKEFVCMGGIEVPASGIIERLQPDSAYNNFCCIDAARKVYGACERLRIPTITLTRWAAYGCPFVNTLLDELRSTRHLLAANIRNTNLTATNALWKKVNLPPEDPRRERLPARCDRQWFCETFLGTKETKLDGSDSIWHCNVNFFMYDGLALLCCVPALRSKHFYTHLFDIEGVAHALIGKSESENPVIVKKALQHEIRALLFGAFREALPLRAKVSRRESAIASSKDVNRLSDKFATTNRPNRFDSRMVLPN